MTEIYGYQVPAIENIHQKVYAAASAPGALDMTRWHTCATTHCWAGWVVSLAGIDGRRLEGLTGTSDAARLIYQASDPSIDENNVWDIFDFYVDDETALIDMRRFAEQEAARQQQAEG